MKTSNKLLIIVVLLIAGCIVFFDLALKAEYAKGNYTDPHYKMTSLSVKDFDAVDDHIANECHLAVRQGDKFQIWLSEAAAQHLKFSVQNHTLKMDFAPGKRDLYNSYVVEITCPKLTKLTTYNVVANGGLSVWGSVFVAQFKQDSMSITSNSLANIYLSISELQKLNVLMNDGRFTVGQNTINTGNFDVRGKSKLEIADAVITHPNYKFADSTEVSFSGQALRQIRR